MLRKLTATFFYISLPLIQFQATGADQGTTGSASLLASAEYYAQRYNWTKAAGYFSRALTPFEASGDKRNALYAKIGFLRGTMESSDLPQLSAYLREQLENPLVANDDRLRLFCFAAKGDVDAEIDSAPAEADWEQVAKLARRLHDKRLESRAEGEIGFHRFVQADYSSARRLTAGAVLYARKTGVGIFNGLLRSSGQGQACTNPGEKSYFGTVITTRTWRLRERSWHGFGSDKFLKRSRSLPKLGVKRKQIGAG